MLHGPYKIPKHLYVDLKSIRSTQRCPGPGLLGLIVDKSDHHIQKTLSPNSKVPESGVESVSTKQLDVSDLIDEEGIKSRQ